MSNSLFFEVRKHARAFLDSATVRPITGGAASDENAGGTEEVTQEGIPEATAQYPEILGKVALIRHLAAE